jgi:hypothetical protein
MLSLAALEKKGFFFEKKKQKTFICFPLQQGQKGEFSRYTQ